MEIGIPMNTPTDEPIEHVIGETQLVPKKIPLKSSSSQSMTVGDDVIDETQLTSEVNAKNIPLKFSSSQSTIINKPSTSASSVPKKRKFQETNPCNESMTLQETVLHEQ